jgi:hypothetical protein
MTFINKSLIDFTILFEMHENIYLDLIYQIIGHLIVYSKYYLFKI